MWNYFGIPGRSVENSGLGLVAVSATMCLVVLAIGSIYLMIE